MDDAGDTTIDARASALVTTLGAHDPASSLRDEPRGDSPSAELETGLDLGRVLGEGGMGVVHVAVQRTLGREVAVKRVRGDAASPRASRKLLREAWTTGALEHPNVVPVHDIVPDLGGEPQIVLKKIEGASWSSLMHDDAAILERFGVRDALDWNLAVLMQVCNAVHFAHSRGVVHRDLKPENVMIGAFGEVYVLDWGLAVRLTDDGSGRFLIASEVREIAGTPVYMAPEMLDGSGARLSPRTDVYLLGAILHEIVTGQPPHVAPRLVEVYARIMRSEVRLPEGTAPPVADTLRRALRPRPEDRFASAEDFRRAIVSLLTQREAGRLAERATVRLGELELEARRLRDDAGRARARLYNLFGECRFGFLEALRVAPDAEAATAGLVRAVTLMAERELTDGDARAAQRLILELGDAPAELRERDTQAVQEQESHEARRRAREADLDPHRGRRMRVGISVVLGLVWTALPVSGYVVESSVGDIDQRLPLVSSIVMLVFGVLVAWLARRALTSTHLNRSLVRAVGVVLGAQCALFAATLWLGVPYAATRPLVLLLYATCCSLTSATVEPRLWPSSVGYSVAAAVALQWPLWSWPVEALANLALTVNVLGIWNTPSPVARGDARRAGDP